MELIPNQVLFSVQNAHFTIPVFDLYLTVLPFFSILSRGFLLLQIICSEDWWIRRWYASLSLSVYSSRIRKRRLFFSSFENLRSVLLISSHLVYFTPCPDLTL